MENTIKKYEELRKKIKAYRFANFLASWDSTTEAPKGCFENRSVQIGVLSEELYKLQTGDEMTTAVEELYKNRNQLDEVLKHEIIVAKEAIEKLKKVPVNEYVEFMSLLSKSEHIWAQAKNKSDFQMFQPILEKIIEFEKKYIKYIEKDDLKGYDVLLDEFEKGYTTKEYDQFFDALKRDLVPFVKNIVTKKLQFNQDFTKQIFPKEQQKEFVQYLADVLCFNKYYGIIKESEHPFTTNFGTTDVRFTVHYYEDMFISSIFSGIHELGHALYEQQINPELDQTFSGGGGSMALHESQSRFYENIIGRSYEFWKVHYPQLKKTFKRELRGISLDDFYKYINQSEASLIRTEADELTYPIHIMIRYDIERAIFNDKIEIKDLPKVWNEKIKEYLGIDVPDDKNGVLQDVHWAVGSFGYFPTYALGSAYAVQIYNRMNKKFNVLRSLKAKDTKKINDWLKENLHKHGKTKYPKELFKMVAKENFNPQYYIDYLIDKYSKLYNI